MQKLLSFLKRVGETKKRPEIQAAIKKISDSLVLRHLRLHQGR